MRARAPGKVVLSGAYAVLEGAPAIVAAVDRYVLVDTGASPALVTDEVGAAIRQGQLERAPWFDATALRTAGVGVADRKLGLGSSAAILVASLAATRLACGQPASGLGQAVFEPALAAHRTAQQGGSGVDVAASCFGGILRCTLDPSSAELGVQPSELPADLVLEVFAARRSASTSAMLAQVRRLRQERPAHYDELLAPARAAASTLAESSAAGTWITCLDRQFSALARLGVAAGVPILTEEMATLQPLARELGACFGPAGAGGGDLALLAGLGPAADRFHVRAREAGLCPLRLRLGAAGVHEVPASGARGPRPSIATSETRK